MTVYGLPSSALADDEAPATSLPVPFLSVCPLLSLSLLPSSHFPFFFHSPLPQPSHLPRSFLSPDLFPAFVSFLFFFGEAPSPVVTAVLCVLQPFSPPPPKPPFTPQQPVRPLGTLVCCRRWESFFVFFSKCLTTIFSFCLLPSPSHTHMLKKISNSNTHCLTHPHTHKYTHT